MKLNLIEILKMKKKTILILGLYLLCGCIPVFDRVGGLVNIYNNSDEPIYFYEIYNGNDSLPLILSLKLLAFADINDGSDFDIGGTTEKPQFSEGVEKITLFFFTDKLLRTYTFKELYEKQLYTVKVVLTEEQLKAMDWKYVYKGTT